MEDPKATLQFRPMHVVLKEQLQHARAVASSNWVAFQTGQSLAARYVWAEVRRARRAFAIGVFTIFLVVFFIR